jgi:hypothetical protein
MCVLAAVAAAQGDKQIVPPGTWADEPATPSKVNVRIKQVAQDYKQYKDLGQFARVGFFDLVQPLDEQEYVALAGHALMLVTTIAREQTELPLRRAYLNVGGREIELQLVSSILSKTNDPNDRVAKIFGAYRADALYLVPLHRRFDRADLFVDFAANKQGLRLGEITAAAFAARDGTSSPLADQPAADALKRVIAREYPRFLRK